MVEIPVSTAGRNRRVELGQVVAFSTHIRELLRETRAAVCAVQTASFDV
jgi:hypothetical protein